MSLSFRTVQRSGFGAILLAMIAIGLVSCNSTTPTGASPTGTATEPAMASPANTATLTPTFSLTLATATRVVQPAASPTVLLSAPQLNQPQDHASFLSGSPVLLQWTWMRSLAADEYFEVQLSRLDAELKDWACSITTSFQIPGAPFGDGGYRWRVIVRRGKINGQQCSASQDLTMPSETRTFEWRPVVLTTQPTLPVSTPTLAPLPPPTPTQLPQPPTTPTRRPYP